MRRLWLVLVAMWSLQSVLLAGCPVTAPAVDPGANGHGGDGPGGGMM